MNRTFKSAVAALILAVGITGSVAAGPFDDAQAAHQRRDYTTEIRIRRSLADQGDADAQFALAMMYASGQGVRQNHVEAAKWLRRAADQGDVLSQSMLGIMYEAGKGVPKDYAAAMSWYRKAADQGDAFSQQNIGDMYANGLGVKQDYAAAVSWYRKVELRSVGGGFLRTCSRNRVSLEARGGIGGWVRRSRSSCCTADAAAVPTQAVTYRVARLTF
jgi:Sel1 repeat